METKKRTREDLLTPYQRNREKFTYEQLLPYDGQWVAFKNDGTAIVAAARTITELAECLTQRDLRPEDVGLEYITFEDHYISGSQIF